MSEKTIKSIRKLEILNARAKYKIISSGEACKFVACQPSVKYFKEVLYPKHPELDETRILTVIKDLQKRCHQKNIYPRTTTILKLALYLAESMHTNQIDQIFPTSSQNVTKKMMEKLGLIEWIPLVHFVTTKTKSEHKFNPITGRWGWISTPIERSRRAGYWERCATGRHRYLKEMFPEYIVKKKG